MTIDDETFTTFLIGRGYATRTVLIYGAILRRARTVAGELGLEIESLDPLGARALSDRWRNTHSSRSQLRAVLELAWELCGRLDGPGRAIRVPKHPRGRCRALPPAQAALLARTAAARGDRKGLAVLLGLYGALRRAEIAALAWDDLDERGWLRVVGKGDVERSLPLHPVLVDALAHACDTWGRNSGTHVFPGRFDDHVSPATIWTWVREVADSCGLEVRTHELRHTALATGHDATGDLRAAMVLAGHARPETTAIYTRTTTGRLLALVESITYEDEEATA